MPRYSQRSLGRLETCHKDLQVLFKTVVYTFDNSILSGHRGEKEQDHLYFQGLSQLQFPDSYHNKTPSLAVDAAPYPIDWEDLNRFYLFGGYVLGIAERLRSQGYMTYPVTWGGDWNGDFQIKDNRFNDLVHFQLEIPK